MLCYAILYHTMLSSTEHMPYGLMFFGFRGLAPFYIALHRVASLCFALHCLPLHWPPLFLLLQISQRRLRDASLAAFCVCVFRRLESLHDAIIFFAVHHYAKLCCALQCNTMLCYAMLRCTVLLNELLWAAILGYAMLRYAMLYNVTLYYDMLCCTARAVLCTIVCCATLNYVMLYSPVHYYAIICFAVLCYAMLHIAGLRYTILCRAILCYTISCDAILQYDMPCYATI